MPAEPVPLQQRLELAEAFCELIWGIIQDIPASRGGVIADARYATARAEQMVKLDRMLEEMLPWYDQRVLEGADHA